MALAGRRRTLDDDEATEAEQSGADCAEAAGCGRDAQCGEGPGGRATGVGGERGDTPPLACPVRRDEGRGGGASQEVGGREQATEATGGGEGARHSDAQARGVGNLVSPSRKCRAGRDLEGEVAVSERRGWQGGAQA